MIRIEGLFKGLENNRALEIDSLNIKGKGVYGLLGKDGAGKTTLLKILSGSSEYDSGSVSVCGHDVATEPMKVKYKVSSVPEAVGFFNEDTVYETLDFVGNAKNVPSERRYRQIKEALELVGLDGQRKKLCGELSPHEKKLLGIAVSLLGNPELILLDEPMKNESAEEKEELAELIKMLGKHKTVIVSSSEPLDIEALCAHFVILSNGKCILDSSAENIRSALGSVRSLDMKLRGDVTRIVGWFENNKAIKKYSYSVDSEKTISVSFEYSSDTDMRENFRRGLKEIGADIVACDGIMLSLSDVYCVLTHEAEEGDR